MFNPDFPRLVKTPFEPELIEMFRKMCKYEEDSSSFDPGPNKFSQPERVWTSFPLSLIGAEL